MPRYSITLNFWVPEQILKNLKKVVIRGKVRYDWRTANLCHCTLKGIAKTDKLPTKRQSQRWIAAAETILSEQRPFKVKVESVTAFPTVIVAEVKSKKPMELHKALCRVLPSSQPQFENHNYRPHVSLVIPKKVVAVSKQNRGFGNWLVREVQLVAWQLKKLDRPTIIHTFRLLRK